MDHVKKYYTEDYDRNFAEIGHYRKYPQMRPFVGSNFGQKIQKILLIGESHYLPKENNQHLNAMNWYSGDSSALDHKARGWINTRVILNKPANHKWPKGHTIYRNIIAGLREAGVPETSNMFSRVAYMNAFQRPAKCNLSLNVEQIDEEIAEQVIKDVLKIIAPQHIISVSKKASKILGLRLNTKHFEIPHPASAWWNRKSSNGTGRQKFIATVKNIVQQP